MKRNVKILDCTLRDGISMVDNNYPDSHIRGLAKGMTDANIDIIELGFLRSNKEYKGNSTVFNQVDQVRPFIPKNRGNSEYVVFTDYGQQYGGWDFSNIVPRQEGDIDGIRVGYRKEDFKAARDTFDLVKENGYKLFIQGVESLNYTDREMLETIDVINEIQPYSFGIVDTYGSMYKDDVMRLFNMVDHNMDPNIVIDLHTHNNRQLSFSFAMEVVEACRKERTVIADCTMEGLGQGAGNLCTELFMDYMITKHHYPYNIDALFDALDEYIDWLREDHRWGYSIPFFLAGILTSHTNNVKYLTKKHRLNTKDIRYILKMIEPIARKRYNYDELEQLYLDYYGKECDDRDAIDLLKEKLSGRPVLVMVPGHTLTSKKADIDKVIKEKDPITISVNRVYRDAPADFAFFGNQRRYNRYSDTFLGANMILSSNIDTEDEKALKVNYNQLIDSNLEYFDNSAVMLFNLLQRSGVKDIMVAGLDGFDVDDSTQFADGYDNMHKQEDYEKINADIDKFLTDYAMKLAKKTSVEFVTPSRFAYIFEEEA